MEKFVYWASGEFLLEKRANGGTVVAQRALLLASLILIPAFCAHAYFAKDTIFLNFSWANLRQDIGTIIPWYGAIFAGLYAAFYTKFASQWSYLANLYNQIMSTDAQANHSDEEATRVMVLWKAGLIEDAQDLHLARKSMFKSVIVGLLTNPTVVKAFCEGTGDGIQRLKRLEYRLAVTIKMQWWGGQIFLFAAVACVHVAAAPYITASKGDTIPSQRMLLQMQIHHRCF